MGKPRKVGEIRSWWIYLVVGVLAALLVLNVLNRLFQKHQSDSREAGPTAPVEFEADGVHLRGWADHGKAGPGDTVGFWLTIENRSEQPIRDLSFLEFRHPGFQAAGNCWGEKGFPVCWPGEVRRGLPDHLDAGAAVSLFARLQARSVSGDFVVSGLLSWKGAVISHRPFAIGPIEVEGAPSSPWLDVSEGAYGFFKDLGLSIILAFLAYTFQRLQSERSRVHETRNLFLGRASENAVQYALPVVNGLNGLLSQIEQWRLPTSLAAGTEQADYLDRGFYYTLYCFKRMRELALKGGGLFLSDIRAEQLLIGHCWSLFYSQVIQYMGYREVSRALDLLDPHETLTSFEKKLHPSGFSAGGCLPVATVEKLRTGFEAWLKGPDFLQIENTLTFFKCVLQYEINRLYGPWYEKEDQSSRKKLEQVALTIKGELTEGQQSSLEGYLADLPKR